MTINPLMSQPMLMAMTVIVGVAGWGFSLDAAKCTSSTQDCLNYMTRNLESRGWVGIEVDDENGIDRLVVTKVVKDSPADKAGFSKGDLLIAINGVVFAESNKKKIRDLQYSMKAGDEVEVRIEGIGSLKNRVAGVKR